MKETNKMMWRAFIEAIKREFNKAKTETVEERVARMNKEEKETYARFYRSWKGAKA